MVWNQAGNKPACFEGGDTDPFKPGCHIWLSKTKRWGNTNTATKNLGCGRKEVKAELERKGKENQLGLLS